MPVPWLGQGAQDRLSACRNLLFSRHNPGTARRLMRRRWLQCLHPSTASSHRGVVFETELGSCSLNPEQAHHL